MFYLQTSKVLRIWRPSGYLDATESCLLSTRERFRRAQGFVRLTDRGTSDRH